MPTRREFIERTSATAALAAMAAPLSAFTISEWDADLAGADEAWNVSWPTKLTGRHKAVFDVAEVESGYGVWRASAWAGQYMQVLKTPAAQLSPVIVLRHNAIVLAMQQSFWEKYGIGKLKSVTHPLTTEPTESNPVLLDETSGIPSPFNQAALHKQLKRGVTVLACNLALQDCVDLIKKSGKSDEEARKEAVAALVPGVILQPSGVFGVIRAQEAGCAYIKAS